MYRNKIPYHKKYHHICQIFYGISMTRGDFAKLFHSEETFCIQNVQFSIQLTGPYRFLHFVNCALNAPIPKNIFRKFW